MAIFCTSDEHYDHLNVIRFDTRPFKDVADMQRGMIERHNVVVSKDDEVWHLGDFSMSEKTVPLILPQLNGTHYLVHGNHDKSHPCQKHSEATKQRYLQYGFAGVYQEVQNFYGFVLNHLPYVGQEEGNHGARFSQWRPVDKGQYLLCGHVHVSWKTKGRMINVGVPQWDYAPVSLDTLIAIRDKQNLIIKTNSQ